MIRLMKGLIKIGWILLLLFAGWQVGVAQDYSSKNYIEQWGRLKIINRQICSEDGSPIQLKGWSTFGLQWQVSCYTESAVETMKLWGANSVRVAMFVNEGGFVADKQGKIDMVKDLIDWTNDLGLYCVVDWHTLTPGESDNPNKTLDEQMDEQGAEYFFNEISSFVKGKGYKHVIYELCNEPNNCSWDDVKNYASLVMPAVQNNDPGALMIIGTPQWSQLIEQAVISPIEDYKDYLLYSFHFYACSHMNLLPKLQAAAVIPVIVSEWGAINFDGDQKEIEIDGKPDFEICIGVSDQFLSVCDGNNNGNVKISWWFWNWGDKFEGGSTLRSCDEISVDNLLASGRYIITKLHGDQVGSALIPQTDGPYNGVPQPIPTPEGGYFEIAYYDLGGEGIAYHDGNGDDPYNYEMTTNCNASYQWYDDEDYNFRNGECVDVSECYGLTGAYTNYNLAYREADEWLKYTVEVAEPGYYSIEYLSNPTTSGTVSFSLERNGVYLGNCLYDIKNSEELEYIYLDSYDEECSASWECWEWDVPLTNREPVLRFEEAGEFILKITFPTEGGELGPFRFKKYGDIQEEKDNLLWTNIVTSRPDSYVETTGSDGKTTITLKDEKALAWLASVAVGYNGATQSSFENTEVVLDADVDMSAHVWSGIKEFYGSLHGQGNSIIGLRINDDTPNGFSLIDTLRKEGEIKDLRLEDVSIDVNAEVGVASFVSWNFGVLKNCSCDGFVQAYYPAGGLVGHNSGEILSCKNSATVAAVGSVGGIANYNYNLIADCVNEGTLSSGNGCGGICNLLGNGEIRNSINKGSVSGKSTSGGVVALCTGSETAILNSCNVANVTVPSGISSFALSGFEGNGVDCSILNCYSSISQPLYSTDDNYDGNVKAQYIYFPSSNTTDKESNEDYIASFSPAEGSDVNDWTLSYEVFGTTDLVEALNAWVAEQDDDIYSSWTVDEDMENRGYPILTFSPLEDLPEEEPSNSLWTDIVTSRPDSYEETTGSDGKTIITIKDEKALAWLASVAAGYNGATQSSFENTEVVLSASVNMSAYVWSCIPNFNGYFNGNKKSITGLRIANNTPNGFAMIATLGEKGEIRNLNLKETELKLTEVKGYIASLVKENKGFIQGCSNEGNLSVISDNRGVHLGGLVSLNYGSIINCSNRGIVSFDCSTCINNIDYQSTAGVAAYPRKGSIISDCINFATISGCSCTGGIAGLGSGVIRNSGNRGDIYGGGSYVGGVSGVFAGDGAMGNCYNTGNVKGSAAVGSLIGYQGSSTVVNCYSASKRPIRGAKEGTTSLSYIYWNSDSLTANESKTNFLLSFKEAEYSQGYDWTLSSEVLGTTDLLTALNNWVIQQDTSIYSGWKAANVQINKGYPILEFGYDPFNQYDTLTVDTLLNLCTKTQYGGKQYTINDEGTVQPVVIGNKYYTNPTLHIKDPDFSKVKVHRPSLICASDTIKLYAEGAESYCWRYGVDTLSVSDGVELVLNEDRRIQLVTEIDGCYRTYNTDVKLNQDSVLIEMGGWGDVIAIKNPNSLFSSYQWYRDGELLEDEMGQFYYEPQGLTPGLYSVDIIDTSGNLVPICPLLIVREEAKSSSQSISLYPNPVRAMQSFYVEVMAPDLDKAVMTVSDESGVEILRRESVAKLNELRLPSGYYVVTVYLSDKKIVSDKILIE